MTNKKSNALRKQRLVLYFSPEEFRKLKARQVSSNCPNMGIYFRTLLFAPKQLVQFHRNRSQDDILEELARIRQHLRSSTMSLQELSETARPTSASWVSRYRQDQKRMEQLIIEVKLEIKKLLEKWLH